MLQGLGFNHSWFFTQILPEKERKKKKLSFLETRIEEVDWGGRKACRSFFWRNWSETENQVLWMGHKDTVFGFQCNVIYPPTLSAPNKKLFGCFDSWQHEIAFRLDLTPAHTHTHTHNSTHSSIRLYRFKSYHSTPTLLNILAKQLAYEFSQGAHQQLKRWAEVEDFSSFSSYLYSNQTR